MCGQRPSRTTKARAVPRGHLVVADPRGRRARVDAAGWCPHNADLGGRRPTAGRTSRFGSSSGLAGAVSMLTRRLSDQSSGAPAATQTAVR